MVGALVPGQDVVADASDRRVSTLAAIERVVILVTQDDVVALVPEDDVPHEAAHDRVGPTAGRHRIVAPVTEDQVIS